MLMSVELTPEQIGFLLGILSCVKEENVPSDRKPNMIEQSFANGIDLVTEALEKAKRV